MAEHSCVKHSTRACGNTPPSHAADLYLIGKTGHDDPKNSIIKHGRGTDPAPKQPGTLPQQSNHAKLIKRLQGCISHYCRLSFPAATRICSRATHSSQHQTRVP